MKPDRTHSHQSNPARVMARRGFTLVEVLIAGIILALGLVGLAAVFPAVIAQQQSATDLSTATSVSATADSILATRLPAFRARFADRDVQRIIRQDGYPWYRINAAESRIRGSRVTYLKTPDSPDLQLRESASYTIPDTGFGGPPIRVYSVRLPRRPVAQDGRSGDLEVVVFYTDLNGPQQFTLVPKPPDGNILGSVFVDGSGADNRIQPGSPNSINYRDGRIEFNFSFNNPDHPFESLDNIRVNYRWLNDRIVSHADRLYPRDNPRYGWEIAFRLSPDNQLQYTTFIYRFDGGSGDFWPEIPRTNGATNTGMLQSDKATVEYDRREDRYILKTSGSGSTGIAAQTETGSWLLPVRGTNPIRLRREIENTDGGNQTWYELEGPPMQLDANGNPQPILGKVDFWYVPSRIKQISDNGQEIGIWHLRTILATTRQVKL